MKIKLPVTLYQRILGILSLLLLLGQFLYLILRWDSLPDQVPTHFGLNGQADAYGSKGSLIFLPIIMIFIYLLMLFVEKFPEVWNVPGHVTPHNAGWIYGNVKSLLVTLRFAICVIFFYINYCSACSQAAGAWFMPATLLLTFGPMVFFLWRAVHYS